MSDRDQLLPHPTNASLISNTPADQPVRSYGSIQEASTSRDPVDPLAAAMPDDKTTLRFLEKAGFSLGHVYNDLCAGIWFSYTLLFMQGVLQMPGPEAGAMVMLGQVGDAIATPIVGFLTDRFSTKRRWHVFGTALVLLTFPLIFAVCPLCGELPPWWRLLYFTAVILVFQFGWPVVQITHLAMIPELSRTQRDRSELTATRYSASICSNVVVYVVTWAVLHLQTSADSKITPADWPKFRDIALILTLIGVSMTVLFHFSLSLSNYEHRRRLTVGARQRRSAVAAALPDTEALISNVPADEAAASSGGGAAALPTAVAVLPRKNFFKSPLLYQNALLYVFSRLFMTTSLVYMPLWLNERAYVPTVGTTTAMPGASLVDGLPDNKSIENIATVPLASFVASFLASMAIKMGDRYVGHKVGYLLGSLVSVLGCAWVALAATPTSAVWELYVVATFFGAGSSVTMIASLCITADMIGPHADQGGFIYSAVTFCDKLITGVAVVIIETIKCKTHDECPTYYRNVLAYGCGASAILGILTLATLICTKSITERIDREERQAVRT